MATRNISLDLDARGKICISVHPGWVQTDMGGKNASITPETSAQGLSKLFLNLTPSDNGRYFNYKGENLNW